MPTPPTCRHCTTLSRQENRSARRNRLTRYVETVCFSHLFMQQSSFYQDRLGTNIGKALKNDYRFLQVVKFEDGTVQNYSTFERPHFVFNEEGVPTHSVHGASPVWAQVRYASRSRSFVHFPCVSHEEDDFTKTFSGPRQKKTLLNVNMVSH